MRTHILCVEVESSVDVTQSDMCERLKRWVANFGHTSSSYGFEFINVSTRARKIKTGRPSTRQRKIAP